MLHNILKLNRVTELSKTQQHQINGQSGVECVRDSDCNDPEQVCERFRCLYFI